MISFTFDLTKSSQFDSAKKSFAIDLYSPPFAKNKLSKDTEKQIKPAEIRKLFKNILLVNHATQSKSLWLKEGLRQLKNINPMLLLPKYAKYLSE